VVYRQFRSEACAYRNSAARCSVPCLSVHWGAAAAGAQTVGADERRIPYALVDDLIEEERQSTIPEQFVVTGFPSLVCRA
jgi:hypothetical protein